MTLANDLFALHPQLARDTLFVTDLALCRVLLMNDARYPWCILVPRIPDVREIFDLPLSIQAEMWREVSLCTERLATLTKAAKMNVATLGNLVPQLHIHVIARSVGDTAWPQPVWGKGEAQPYTAPASTKRVEALQLTFAR
jgi:diadenosine tetraphosphate (Ap4A) HIT family hydrolase